MRRYMEFYRQSIDQPDVFWTNEARFIDWHKPFAQVCDYSHPPFAKWFVGGATNLCYNAVDRHAAERPHGHARSRREAWAIRRPARLYFVSGLPKTRPAKMLRWSILALRGWTRSRRSQHA